MLSYLNSQQFTAHCFYVQLLSVFTNLFIGYTQDNGRNIAATGNLKSCSQSFLGYFVDVFLQPLLPVLACLFLTVQNLLSISASLQFDIDRLSRRFLTRILYLANLILPIFYNESDHAKSKRRVLGWKQNIICPTLLSIHTSLHND